VKSSLQRGRAGDETTQVAPSAQNPDSGRREGGREGREYMEKSS
jgi:hypothetical protein